MAKRFRSAGKTGNKKIIKEEIVEDGAEEEIEIEEVIPEGKKSKEDFLRSKGLHDRPNSHMAIKAWEEYIAS